MATDAIIGRIAGEDAALVLTDANGNAWRFQANSTDNSMTVTLNGTVILDFDASTVAFAAQTQTVTFADNNPITFGTGSDVTMKWDATDFLIAAAADDSMIKVGDGTLSLDLTWYGGTASDTFVFDASANLLTFNGIDIRLLDADVLQFGDAQDVSITWDGTDLKITGAADDQVINVGNGTNSFDVKVFGNTTGEHVVFDASANLLTLTGIKALLGGRVGLGAPEAVTIASGVATITRGFVKLDAEGAGTTDQLDTLTMTGVADGEVVVLISTATDTITVDDANINLGAASRALAPGGTLILRYDAAESQWTEVSFLAGADNV